MPEKPRRRLAGAARFTPATTTSSSSSPLPPPAAPPNSSSANAPGNGGGVDNALFKNLVEMVPLVECLMDRKANPSFRRRASMVYTPAPSSQTKLLDREWKKASQTSSAKEQKDCVDQGSAVDNLIFSSEVLTEGNAQKDMEELAVLREQLDGLHKKLSEKDEALKSVNESMNQMSTVSVMLDELRRQLAEKDSVVRSANSQLSNTQIKLADRQAALEKLEWEARASNKKIEQLEGDLDSMDFEISAFMQLFLELSKSDSAEYSEEISTSFHQFDQLPDIDNIDDMELARMEEARMVYFSAITAAKENPCDESLAAVAEARLRLEAFVL